MRISAFCGSYGGKMNRWKIALCLCGWIVTIQACSFSSLSPPTAIPTILIITATLPPTEAPTQTPYVLIATTEVPPTQTAVSSSPTPTIQPSVTASLTPTATAIPCNRAEYVADINFPDGSLVLPGADFTKTWKLRNTGSCTWTSSYKLVFAHGDRMNAPDWVKLTSSTVPPGGTVNVSVDLTAPSSEGTYQADFRLRGSDGSDFGIGYTGMGTFYVQITVKRISIPTTNPLPIYPKVPDLTISSYSFTPATPQADVSTTVHITVKNQGSGPADTFTVRYYQSDSAGAGCAWAVPSLAAGASKSISCSYIFPSYYFNLRTRAVVDDDGKISESDETNNISYLTINVSR